MGKIKGWKKYDIDVWTNTKRKETVSILKGSDWDNYYYVIVQDAKSERQYDNALTNLSDARKSAITYMRMNP